MKKHILGFAIFSFIFASFAFAFTYFYAPPIPQIQVEEEKIEIQVETVEKTSCFKQKKKDISYQIQYTQFDSDNNQFISKIYASWIGKGDAPKQLIVGTKVYTLGENQNIQHSAPTVFNEPFKDGKEALLVVKFKLPNVIFENKKQNLYAIFNFADNYQDSYDFKNGLVTSPQSVLYFHR